MADDRQMQGARTFLRATQRQFAPLRRLYRQGRLDGLFLLPLFLWFALWATEQNQIGLAIAVMLIWSVAVMLYQVALYQVLVALLGLAILVFVILKWPVWVGAILVGLYVAWLRRTAMGKRHQ